MPGGANSGEFYRAAPIGWAVPVLLRRSLLYECIAYDPATMAQSRSRAALGTVLRIACDLVAMANSKMLRKLAIRKHSRCPPQISAKERSKTLTVTSMSDRA